MSSSSSASATTTSPTEIATISKMSSQKKEDPLIQQQQQMRAKSIEKELERKRQRQIEKDNPSTTPKSKVDAALENPAFIQHVLNSPENVDKMLNETETSVYELLYKDPIDYTGEHLMEAFSFQPLIKSNNDEYMKLYSNSNGNSVEELKKSLKKGLNDNSWTRNKIESTKAFIEMYEENQTMFKEKKSMTTITQAAQMEQEQEHEDKNDDNKNNVFNELITYYNGGGGSDLK
ncbi:hypothetical protein FRACYDRAFT_258284 [Fragilariopsis cylindrus CCMP1102]|uniref:Uncharacterized protein n=1 Tax=Fragilariopsis cylindrus CCMP1102 TaxID=635003 RepID=A0A1E7EIR2_9STRA|nr:hypothetical protein FRACYDRAFT_258284 [Fragilariopsis cylindrus CCMP1102]|eukprot:OEU05781.1 hypothetical protein FRACYDRAFT_258284 [Fragilariopsis cylindrus CCMP1102]